MKAETFFLPLLTQLTTELREERGQIPASSGRGCPLCGKACYSAWGRNAQRYSIHHFTPSTCPLRFEVLGTGQSENEAWADFGRESAANAELSGDL